MTTLWHIYNTQVWSRICSVFSSHLAEAKRSDGSAIFCGPCDAWVTVSRFDHHDFEIHCDWVKMSLIRQMLDCRFSGYLFRFNLPLFFVSLLITMLGVSWPEVRKWDILAGSTECLSSKSPIFSREKKGTVPSRGTGWRSETQGPKWVKRSKFLMSFSGQAPEPMPCVESLKRTFRCTFCMLGGCPFFSNSFFTQHFNVLMIWYYLLSFDAFKIWQFVWFQMKCRFISWPCLILFDLCLFH